MPRLIPLLLLILVGCNQSEPGPVEFQVADVLSGGDTEGYARVTQRREFQFPEDHGPHPEFRNEWWYLTGNLETRDGRRFGIQVTFFRFAMQPQAIDSPSAWRSSQIWMAHAALSDLDRGEHQAYERFARQGAGLAGARIQPFQVWLEDWRLEEKSSAEGTGWRLQISTQGFELSLSLAPAGPIILQGDRGLSQKSAEPGNASYYYSIPRLEASGRLTRGGQDLQVAGLAWFDREWSTSALGADQEGWDWFSLQLLDGRNLMYYRLRSKSGGADPHSGGSLSDGSGLIMTLGPDSLSLTPLRFWNSGGRRYPVDWRLHLPGETGPWQVRALTDDQEMTLSVRYWEGAVEVVDERSGRLLGRGYLEMAGYR